MRTAGRERAEGDDLPDASEARAAGRANAAVQSRQYLATGRPGSPGGGSGGEAEPDEPLLQQCVADLEQMGTRLREGGAWTARTPELLQELARVSGRLKEQAADLAQEASPVSDRQHRGELAEGTEGTPEQP